MLIENNKMKTLNLKNYIHSSASHRGYLVTQNKSSNEEDRLIKEVTKKLCIYGIISNEYCKSMQ